MNLDVAGGAMFRIIHQQFVAVTSIALALGTIVTASSHAAAAGPAISDRQLVHLRDGRTAYVFRLDAYDKAKDGDVFLLVTDAGGRKGYQPVLNAVNEPPWQGLWGVTFDAGVKPTKFEVVILGNPGAWVSEALLSMATGKWTLADVKGDAASIQIVAEGDPAKGFTLDGIITVKDLGDFKVNGLWGTDNPSQVVFTVDNTEKALFEATLGKTVPQGWFTPGDKITATVGLAPEWVEQLKKGGQGAKTIKTGKFTVEITVPFKLKVDPANEAFKMTAKIDPQKKIATVALDAGEVWKEPFGFLPVTFSKIDLTTDVKFSSLMVKAVSDVDFIVKTPVDMDLTLPKGAAPILKLKLNPDVKLVTGALKLAKVPVELTDVITPVLEKIKMGSFDITTDFSNPLGAVKLPSANLKFSIELPNWKHDFDVKVPSVDFKKPGDFAIAIGDEVFPVLQANIDKIAMGVAIEFATGKWPLVDIDIDPVKLKLDAEGDPKKGFTLVGLAGIKDVGDLKLNGLWSSADPSKVEFTVDNPAKSILEATVGKVAPKEWLELDKKIYVTIGLAPEWQEQLKLGAKRKAVAKASQAPKYTIAVRIPFKMKIDPKKNPFKMTARLEPQTKVVSITMDDGQTWDKPLDLIPVKFDKLTLATDAAFTTLTVKSAGKMDFLVACDVDLTVNAQKATPPAYTVNLKPAAGTNIVKAILDGRVPPALSKLVDGLLPGTVVEEMTVVMDAKKSKPDVRLKFTMTKESLSQKFDILVKEADLGNPTDFAGKAAPQIIDQLSGGAIGAATTELLDKLGLSGDWTLIDLNIAKQLILKVNVKGAPSKGYDMTSDIKPLIFEKFTMKGRWDPAKPTDPVKFTADKNVFKPAFDATIGKQMPQGSMELKDELFVTVTFPSAATDALKGGGSGGASTSADGFDIEIGFPMKLKIDPTRGMFDMIGSVYPMKGQVGLALAPGQTWDKPFGFVPATFNTLNVATDPSFTTVTVHGEGISDFVEGEKIDFKLDLTMAANQKPDLKIQATPTVGLAKAIMKKANIPAALQDCIATIELKKIKMNVDFATVAAGGVPDCELAFTVNHPIAGKLDIYVTLPAGDMKDPANFAKKAAESVLSQLQNIVGQIAGNVTKTLENAAKDPIGTAGKLADKAVDVGKDLGNGAKDFAKDPLGSTKKLGEAALNTMENLGQDAFNKVKDEANKWANDPIGEAKKKGEAAIAAAEQALDAAEGVLSDAAEFLADLLSDLWDAISGQAEVKARAAKKAAEDEVQRKKDELKAIQAEAERGIREATALESYRIEMATFSSQSQFDELKKRVLSNPDLITINVFLQKIPRPNAELFIKEMEQGLSGAALRKYQARMKYATSVAELNNISAESDADAGLTGTDKATLQAEINALINPPVASRDDALIRIREIIAEYPLTDLKALKQHLDGKKVDRYFRYPTVNNLSAAEKVAVKLDIDAEITKRSAEFSAEQFKTATEYVMNATSSMMLDRHKALLKEGSEDAFVSWQIEYLTADHRKQLIQKIDERMKTVKADGSVATMKEIREFTASVVTEYVDFVKTGKDKMFGPDLKGQLRAIRAYAGDLQKDPAWRSDIIPNIEIGRIYDLSDEQKTTLVGEIDAILKLEKPDFMGAEFDPKQLTAGLAARNAAVEATAVALVAEVKKIRDGIAAATTAAALDKFKASINDNAALTVADKTSLNSDIAAKLATFARDKIASGTFDSRLDQLQAYLVGQPSNLSAADKAIFAPLTLLEKSTLHHELTGRIQFKNAKEKISATWDDDLLASWSLGLAGGQARTYLENSNLLTADQSAALIELIAVQRGKVGAKRDKALTNIKENFIAKEKSVEKLNSWLDTLNSYRQVTGFPDMSTLTSDQYHQLRAAVSVRMDGIANADYAKAYERLNGFKTPEEFMAMKKSIWGEASPGYPSLVYSIDDALKMKLYEAFKPQFDRARLVTDHRQLITDASTPAMLKQLVQNVNLDPTLSAADKGELIKRIETRQTAFAEPEAMRIRKSIPNAVSARALYQLNADLDAATGIPTATASELRAQIEKAMTDIATRGPAQAKKTISDWVAAHPSSPKIEWLRSFLQFEHDFDYRSHSDGLYLDFSISDPDAQWMIETLKGLPDKMQRAMLRNELGIRAIESRADLTAVQKKQYIADFKKELLATLEWKVNNVDEIEQAASLKNDIALNSILTANEKAEWAKKIDDAIARRQAEKFAAYEGSIPIYALSIIESVKTAINANKLLTAKMKVDLCQKLDVRITAEAQSDAAAKTFLDRITTLKSVLSCESLKSDVNASTTLTPKKKTELITAIDAKITAFNMLTPEQKSDLAVTTVRDLIAERYGSSYGLLSFQAQMNLILDGKPPAAGGLKFEYPDVSALGAAQRTALKAEVKAAADALPNIVKATTEKIRAIIKAAQKPEDLKPIETLAMKMNDYILTKPRYQEGGINFIALGVENWKLMASEYENARTILALPPAERSAATVMADVRGRLALHYGVESPDLSRTKTTISLSEFARLMTAHLNGTPAPLEQGFPDVNALSSAQKVILKNEIQKALDELKTIQKTWMDKLRASVATVTTRSIMDGLIQRLTSERLPYNPNQINFASFNADQVAELKKELEAKRDKLPK